MDRARREQLLRLRQILGEAQGRADDTSAPGRHVALILLDGACETAMKIAADGVGVTVSDRIRFPELVQQLTDELPQWNKSALGDVIVLHSVRNLAQHRAVTPDGEELARWATATDTFVRGLVAAAFEIDLAEIHLADGIRDDTLREQLHTAETALDRGEVAEALPPMLAAFDAARATYRGERDAASDRARVYVSQLGVTSRDGATQAILQLNDLVDVIPFADNLGEYVWLQARRDDFEGRSILPAANDARRAYRFILDWILRWEAFSSRFEGRRYHPPAETVVPTTGPDDPPLIVDVAVQRRDEPQTGGTVAAYAVALQLANVPANEHAFHQFFQVALADLPPGQLETSGNPMHGSLYSDGIVRFWHLPSDVDPETLVARVERAARVAVQQFRDLQARQARWAQECESILEPWRAALSTVTFSGERLFDAFEIEGIFSEAGEPTYLVQARAPRLALDDVGARIWEVLNEVGVGMNTEVAYVGDHWQFRQTLNPDDAAARAQEIASALEQAVERECAKQMASASEEAAFEAKLRGAIHSANEGGNS